MCRTFLAVIVTAVFLTFAVAQATAEQSEVLRVRRLIESEGQVILFFAHPTVTCDSVRYDGCRGLRDGYAVNYTFNWTGLTDTKGYSELTFVCDSNGRLDFIRVGDSSAVFFKPFTGSNFAVNALKRKLQKEPALQNDRQVMKVLEKDAKEILETYLRRDIQPLVTVLSTALNTAR